MADSVSSNHDSFDTSRESSVEILRKAASVVATVSTRNHRLYRFTPTESRTSGPTGRHGPDEISVPEPPCSVAVPTLAGCCHSASHDSELVILVENSEASGCPGSNRATMITASTAVSQTLTSPVK